MKKTRIGIRYALATATAGLALASACGGSSHEVAGPPACSASVSLLKAPAVVPGASPFDTLFDDAAREFKVPASLLRSISYVETRWQMVHGQEEFQGQPAAHGVMALRGSRLTDGARLARVTEEDARLDARSNIRAAAALLASYGAEMGVASGSAEAWAPAVAKFSGIELAQGRESYTTDVYAVREGHRAPASPEAASSRAATDPCATTPKTPVVPAAPVTDEAGVTWRASPNFNSRMSGAGGTVHMVIIHSCEGAYAGCWSWLANPASEVSAHYVVREDGGEITQLVRESARAWHIGATYDATLNAGHELGLLQGVQSNHFTIGIEHGGFASQTTWPVAQIDASARLVCDIARRWQIPRDKLHFVSHGQLQPYNRTDPGANWPWADYLARIDKYCTI